MRAVFVDVLKENSNLRLAEIECPTPKDNQVLVRIQASGVNPIDVKIRTGKAPYAKAQVPAILGMDLAGVVEKVGSNVTGYRVGDEVYGLTGGLNGIPGTLAEFAAVDPDFLAKKPTHLSMREAAAIPLVYLTAWEGLVDRARIQPGQKVLILGGSGGVGHIAVQIAKAFGAEVFATASPEKHPMVKECGATPIDRKMPIDQIVETFTQCKGFDIVYDTVGGSALEDAFKAVRNYGHALSCVGFAQQDLKPISFRGASYSGVFVLLPALTGEGRLHHGNILREATKMAETGKLHPVVDPRRFTLETADQAHHALMQGTAFGKLVIDLV